MYILAITKPSADHYEQTFIFEGNTFVLYWKKLDPKQATKLYKKKNANITSKAISNSMIQDPR